MNIELTTQQADNLLKLLDIAAAQPNPKAE